MKKTEKKRSERKRTGKNKCCVCVRGLSCCEVFCPSWPNTGRCYCLKGSPLSLLTVLQASTRRDGLVWFYFWRPLVPSSVHSGVYRGAWLLYVTTTSTLELGLISASPPGSHSLHVVAPLWPLCHLTTSVCFFFFGFFHSRLRPSLCHCGHVSSSHVHVLLRRCS